MEYALELIANGTIHPVVSGSYGLAELPEVHRQMEAGAVAGRVVIRPGH
jgi:NADPH:quinone reductase-like Zn-dependent oxidoreductase